MTPIELEIQQSEAELAAFIAVDEYGNNVGDSKLLWEDGVLGGYEADGVTKYYDADEMVDHEDRVELLEDELEILKTHLNDEDGGTAFLTPPVVAVSTPVEVGVGQEADVEDQVIVENTDASATAKGTSKKRVDIRPNQLHTLASYSIQYDFYMMPFEDFNDIQDTLISTNPTDSFSTLAFNFAKKPGRLLMSSAGVQRTLTGGNSNHNRFFQKNYHIDDISIDSYVGTKSHAGAKVTNVSMKISEPYGATLLENLIKAAVGFKSKWYIEMPYMLKISFKGVDDSGRPVTLDNSTKYLMLKIGDINFNVSQNGSEYNVSLYKYSDSAFSETTGSLPNDIQVNCETIADFFGITEVGYAVDNNTSQGIQYVNRQQVTQLGVPQLGYQNKTVTVAKKGLGFKDFPDIINQQWTENIQDAGRNITKPDFPDEYSFSIDNGCGPENMKKLLNAKILKADSLDINNYAVYTGKLDAPGILQYKSNISAVNPKGSKSIQLNAGVSIVNVIHTIISSSSFMTDQVTVQPGYEKTKAGPMFNDPATTYKLIESEKSPILLYKITPIVTVGEWDNTRGQYQKKIKYVITLHESKGNSPDSLPSYGTTDIVKKYNWIYTGQNKDVLDFDLDFSAAGFQKKMIGGYASGLENAIDKGATPLGTSIVPVYRFGDAQGHVVFDHRAYSLTRTDQNDWSAGSKSDYRTVMAQNFMSQIYSKGVDAMTGKITIVGDPDWITQDEGFGLSVNNSLYVNGSVNTHRDPTIQINFKTPPDIDTETGLMATHSGDTEYGNSISLFSGYYKITLIKTTIENNTFKQELEIIRVTNQEIEKEPEGESTIHADIQPGTTGYEAWKTNVPDGDVTVAMDIDWNNVG